MTETVISGLSDILDRFLREPFPKLRLRATTHLAGSVAKLDAVDVPMKRPEPDDLATICRRVDAILAAGGPLSRRDLKRAPWCLWAPDLPLAEIPGRLDALLAQLVAAGRVRVYRILALAWGHAFAVGRAGIAPVGRFLRDHAAELGPAWEAALRQWPLFDAERGPASLAEAAIAAGVTPERLLEQAKLRDLARCVGFLAAVRGDGLARLEHGAMPDHERRLETVRAWILDETGKVRFQSLAGPAVRAVLDPFGEAMPDKEVRDRFLSFALSVLGDPRSQDHRWTACPKSREIARRWLTEQTLRQFLDVVDRVAPVTQWQYRRAFWYALWEKDAIDEAWVVFESHGETEARRMFGKEIEFGRFDGPVQPGHSVLLLKIGTLTVAEWSHVGICSFWDEALDEQGPPLYRKRYPTEQLRKPYTPPRSAENLQRQGVFYHWNGDTYSWQERIAEYLRQRRRINLTRHAYWVR